MIQAAASLPESFVPLALELEDLMTYGRIADAIGCDLESCAEGFMLATPVAREAAVQLWQELQAQQAVAETDAQAARRAISQHRVLAMQQALLRLLGLDPGLPPAALAAVGLRYDA